jgi:hypothetical protein
VNLSNAQIGLLITLNSPYKEYEKKHLRDAYKNTTVESLIRLGLVEEYHYISFLHGAIRLTNKGKEIVNEQ